MSILSYDRCCGVKIELFTCNHIARLKPHPSLPLDGERELNFTESFIIQSSLIKRGKHSSLVLQTIYWRCFHNHREGLLLDKSTYYQQSLSHLRHYDKLGCHHHHHKGRVTLWIDANQHDNCVCIPISRLLMWGCWDTENESLNNWEM